MRFLLMGLALGIMAFNAGAQNVDEDFKLIQKLWGKEKKALVNEALQLKSDEAEKFWPLYESYQETRKKLGQERLAAIENYGNSFETMTDAKATEIAKSILANNKGINKLQSSYLKKISKAVSPIKAVQFLQLESFFDSQIRAALSEGLPLFPGKKQ